MHLSFREFLLDTSRSGPWHITDADIARGHCALALGGLRIMGSKLEFDMHSLPSSDSTGEDIAHHGPIPRTPLEYSIATLDRHLSRVLQWGLSAKNSVLFHHAIRRLLYDKLLFWIEWTLVRREMHVRASAALDIMQHILSGEVRQFAEEALSFVQLVCMENRAVEVPAHLYLSGLPFAPTDSLIRRRFIRHFPGIPTVRPAPESWAWAVSEGVRVDTPPLLAWSTDCRYIREDNRDGPTRCCDAQTGNPVDLPSGIEWRYPSHESADGGVKVSFSRPGYGSEKLHVHVDRQQTNPTPARLTISITLSGRYQADVSPDGKLLALVHGGGAWRQWDLETGSEIHLPMEANGRNEHQAATFSPDSREIVCSATFGCINRVYTVYDGAATMDPAFWTESGVDSWTRSWVNFDADLFREMPFIWYPLAYYRLLWQPCMRLLLGGEMFTFDMANVRYGSGWARCYAGTLEEEATGDEYFGVDVEMEAADSL